jgi:hypothetical protein
MTIEEIVTGFLEQKKNEVRTAYEAKGRSASGEAGKSLTVNVSEQPNKIVGSITGSHYWYYIEHGRRPGKRPPIESIEKWIDDRRLSLDGITKQSLAFLIARKIGREGTKGTPILESVFTPQSLQELGRSNGSAYLSNVKSDIVKKFQ